MNKSERQGRAASWNCYFLSIVAELLDKTANNANGTLKIKPSLLI
ncbi:hypothetical protein B6N60_02881 [Richelia sinica FACHB-800]|uniref:Uncharacterized protein n=1 Tax=Richelia sinica FACHB-800 TaxID=1357546 RepID=A0A975Y5G0_9NOST|nr:hypothetical protein [Richelia sinica]QXE24177.1 hypothetical protein B6N60_02881 [Richelia sinica FACHB-800]